MRKRTTAALGTLLCLAGLSGCALAAQAGPEINRETDWVQDYSALGEPISAAAAVRDQDDSRIPAMDDLYDTVLQITPAALDELVSDYPDLTVAELNSFTPDWVLQELPEDATWQHSDELDARLENEDGRPLIVDCYLDPAHDRVVLILMEM